MFWKKKKTSDLNFEGQNDDHRAAFRVVPDIAKPIIVTIRGHAFKAINISGTGVCIRTHNIPEGTVTAATVRLPSEDIIFPVTLEVMLKQGDLCRCSFRKIHREAEDLLHAYILDLQKAKIRQNQAH
ncbi:MAG: hypothetical protein ACI9JR_000968 [Gammaproteobacteria bacterium]